MELISKVKVHPLHRQDFRAVIKAFLDGEAGELELRERCRGLSRESLQHFIDTLNGEACLYSVGMSGVPRDEYKANRLFSLVALLEPLLQE